MRKLSLFYADFTIDFVQNKTSFDSRQVGKLIFDGKIISEQEEYNPERMYKALEFIDCQPIHSVYQKALEKQQKNKLNKEK